MPNPVGPPTKWKDDIPKRLIDFFTRDLFVDVDGKKMPNRLPTVEKFCCEIDITKDTFYRWVKEKPVLSDAFSKAKSSQKDQLVQLALMGFYKEGFAKFVAVNMTDMSDKKETTHNVSEETKKLIIDMND